MAQVSLLASGVFATWVKVPTRVVGWLAGLGAGALFSAIAFDLTDEARSLGFWLALWLLFGAAIFIVGDLVAGRLFGAEGTTAPLGIVVGAVVDGVPESVILGIGVATGEVAGTAFLIAVIVSNIPQAVAPSADLFALGWSRARIVLMWSTVVVTCGLASAFGYLVVAFDESLTNERAAAIAAAAAALAAGGLLTMLTNSLMPFAFDRGGRFAGVWTVVGFALSLALV